MESEELTSNQRYYRNNLEREKARKLAHYHANKDKVSEEEKTEKKKYMKEYRLRNLEKWKRTPEQQAKINARRREKYAQDPSMREQYQSAAREWQRANPGKKKAQRLRVYGLTIDEFNALLEAQGGGCAICGYSDRSKPKLFPIIDHCHITGAVRGLLCANCNHALGKLKEDPSLFRRAASYLEVNRG